MLLYYVLSVCIASTLPQLSGDATPPIQQQSSEDSVSINTILQPGSKAPDFSLPDQTGNQVSLTDFLGKYVVLYFYPKDNTPGCTKESCDFRDNFETFKEANVTVLGMSPDSVASHVKFISGHNLPFTLLSDTSKETLRLYGVWGKKSFAGKSYEGVIRSTVLIDPQGSVVKVWSPVSVSGHVDEVWSEVQKAIGKDGN